MEPVDPKSVIRSVALTQGIFYLVTGIWPFLHMKSFEKINGPKLEHWLVYTLGGLITVTGIVLCSSARRREVTGEVAALAMGHAGTLSLIDVFYTSKGVLPKTYLLDATAELLVIAGWLKALRMKSQSERVVALLRAA
jgi:hypothetical protein